MLTLHTHQLDIPKMNEQQWHDLLNAREEFANEFRTDEPVPLQEDERKFLSQIPELRNHVVIWLFYDDEANCVGYCFIQHPKPESPDYDANKDRIYVEPVVLARYRRQGVGTQLLPRLVNYAQKVGVSWIEWDTKFESGFRFSEKIGATQAGRQRTNRLTVDQLDWDRMQRWVDQGHSNNPDVEMIRIVNLPAPDLISPLCDLITDINLLQPRDDLEGISYTLTPEEMVKEAKRLEERKIERVIIYARHPDGTLSGMTDLFFNQAKPTHASIRLTGVRREFQNRGLGKWLKAAMMLHMRVSYTDVKFVDTDNFNNNPPMLSINDRMGYQPFEQYVFYKIRVHDLAVKVDLGSLGHPGNG